MDRAELADFLRHRRERLAPVDVGMPSGARRRTPGLRREEVAHLAGMSTDYLARLEQARGPHPSTSMLAALARALRLSDDERDHMYYLGGWTPPPRITSRRHVTPGLLHLLDHLTDSAAFVVSDVGEILVQNRLAVALFGEQTGGEGLERSMVWRWFTDPKAREPFPREDWPHHSRAHVADLRATASRRHGDADVAELVDTLLATSPEFTEIWATHEVATRRADHKRVIHPEVGLLDLQCEVVTGASGDQLLVVLYATPGTDARERLELLAVIGTQHLMT